MSNRERKISYDITYMWNLKQKDADELTYKTEIDPQTQKTNLWLLKQMGEINQKFWINIYTLLYILYIKQVNNKDLLYISGNYIQYLVLGYNGEQSENYIYIHIYIIHMCVTESLCCISETNRTLQINYFNF